MHFNPTALVWTWINSPSWHMKRSTCQVYIGLYSWVFFYCASFLSHNGNTNQTPVPQTIICKFKKKCLGKF